MGSGILIKKAILKYGLENFIREILYECSSLEELNIKEKELVSVDFVIRRDTYNICEGGYGGGFSYINRTGKNLYGKNGQYGFGKQNLLPGDIVKKILLEENRFEEFRKKVSDSKKIHYKENGSHWTGKTHKKETIEKQKEIFSIIKHQQGINNSQFGTCWITNGKENKKIKKEDIDNYLELGYCKGRIINN